MKRILIIFMVIIIASPVSGEWVSAESGLNLRTQTSLKSEVLAVMPYGSEVKVSRTIGIGSDIWGDIEYQDLHGFAKMEWLSKSDPKEGMTLMGEWRITAYAYTGSPCASGAWPSTGVTVAHNSLPFGTRVFIEDVGFRTVEDRGPSQMGDEWLDLYLGDTQECIQWGVQNKKVWVEYVG